MARNCSSDQSRTSPKSFAAAPERASVCRDELGDLRPGVRQALQSRRGARPSIERAKQPPDLLRARVDDRVDQVVAGLEVVVDVAGGDVCCVCDLGERRSLHALVVQQLGRAGHEAFALARPLRRV
jgi:hypothetical protein